MSPIQRKIFNFAEILTFAVEKVRRFLQSDRGFPIKNEAGELLSIAGITEDITQRKQTEAIIYKREQEFIALVENSPDIIVRLDRQLRHVYINPAIEKETGISPQAFIGKTIYEVGFPPEVVTKMEEAFQEILLSKQERLIEFSLPTPEGVKIFQSRLVPEINQNGVIDSCLGVAREITPLCLAETALRQQVKREQIMSAIATHMRESLDLTKILNTIVTELQTYLQADRVLVYQIEPNYSGTVVAEAVASRWNSLLNFVYSAEVCPQETRQKYLQGCTSAICDTDHPDASPCMVEFLRQIQVRAKLVVPIIRKNNLWGLLIVHQCSDTREWYPWETSLLQQLADQLAIAIQQSILYQQLQEELRERQIASSALRQSEIEFRSLSENSPIGIFRTDAQGFCTYTNPRYHQICDCSFEEALGDGWTQTLHPEDRETILANWSTAVSQMQQYTKERRYVRKDGSIRYCEVQAVPILGSSGELIGHVGTLEDITESRAIAQMKNEFISVVSHELRTPLTSLRGSLGLLASGVYDTKPEKGKRMLQVASLSSARLVRLVSDILDLERLESGKVNLVMQSCDAATLMEQSVEAMTSAEQNNITISFIPLKVEVWAAPDTIIQTITNLLSNAVKFSQPGSTIWLNAKLQQLDTKDYVLGDNTDKGEFTPPLPPSPL